MKELEIVYEDIETSIEIKAEILTAEEIIKRSDN